MVSFFEWLVGRRSESSAEIAKERLKLVLVTDRSNLPQERLEAMQAEIIEVIKRYVEVDELQVQLKVEQRDRKNFLVADIPIHRNKAYQVASENAPPPIPSVHTEPTDKPDVDPIPQPDDEAKKDDG